MPATHSSPDLQCVSNVENSENHFGILEHAQSLTANNKKFKTV